ncbi:transglycosylase domain-containing protein [Auritidibacter ignavus]|uniref:transglycosylase domain-containing protein n=1 Tax=Auritidibacter ignavus TaxID=678932 RepID=UPI0024B9AE65|nr:transglycosylase domain-containing protein [Auritidibacter ignavus]WHS35532.1 transglycosylase domain-containing protein [Auritidibacter ignavus]
MAKKFAMFDMATTMGKIFAFFGVSALCGGLAAGLALPLGMVTGAAATTGTELLDELPAELQEEPMSVPSRIVDKDGTELATFYAENREPVSLDEISEEMQQAIIAIEDERFYEHSGVDPQGLARAVVNNATSDTRQGASTLTQQYVNNVLVNYQNLNGLRTTVSGTKTPADKLREMKLAVALEKKMSKEEILEGYLNIVLFSGRTYGVEAAANHFFNKSASELDLSDAAILAGMVQSPNALNPETNPESAQNRRNVVLQSMENAGFITTAEKEKAQAQDLGLDITPKNSGCIAAQHNSGYFCDYVHRQILNDPAFGPDPESRQQLLDRGGLTIKTTLDAKMQKAAAEEANKAVPREETQGFGSSIVTVEQDTGNIRAMAQNTVYSPEDGAGNTQINYSVDHADGGGQGFQAGSTLKPFVSLAWLGAGHSMSDTVNASRDDYTGAKFPAYCLDGGKAQIGTDGWNINNTIGNMKKPMPMNYGLYWSINTATVGAAFATDLCSITDITDAAGVHGAVSEEGLDPQHPSFLLGAQEVSPLTMASAFSTMGSYGNYCEARALTEVTDAAGNEYEVPPVQCNENVLNEDHIVQLNSTLKPIAKDRIAEGNIDFDIAGKTGTNNNESSTWFVGYTEGLTTAAWVGNYQSVAKTLKGNTIGGTYYEDVWGSLIAGPMWIDYMKQVAEDYPHGEIRDDGSPSPRSISSAKKGGSNSSDDDENNESSDDPSAESAESSN